MVTETVFGSLWTRPGLDLKTRTLVCVVSDAATGQEPELAIHMRMALRQGWTEEELTEVLLHLSGYVGAPLVREAFLTAKQVFADVTSGPLAHMPSGVFAANAAWLSVAALSFEAAAADPSIISARRRKITPLRSGRRRSPR